MMKRTVHFKPDDVAVSPRVGHSAVVFPLDHDDTENVSNTTHVHTSEVVKVNDDGSFETLNSIYIPQETK